MGAAATLILHGHPEIKLFDANVPAQTGFLFDLFILGYGLSLKAREADKKLVNYLLENQQLVEVERSRLARDLHDGLGGMLSGIKLNLASMRGNIILPEKDTIVFSNSILQLDNAIGEMRRVAHNMMPESLLKFGLLESVQNFCDSLNESGVIHLHFEHFRFDERLNHDLEITTYRMIQELVNNSIKHSGCKKIIIQLSKNEDNIQLIVEDDGKGFDVAKLKEISGMGYQNLNNRVGYLKGNINTKSNQENGTSVLIEFPIT